jgi:hypothetical protein
MMDKMVSPDFAKALLATQKSLKPAKKDTNNPHFKKKYADLSSVWEACRAALHDNGFVIIQSPDPLFSEAGLVGILMRTTLLHESGEAITTSCAVQVEGVGPQKYGAAIQYARRYGLGAATGVISEDDDDANDAQSAATASKPYQPRTLAPEVKAAVEAFLPGDDAGWKRRIELYTSRQSVRDDKQFLLNYLEGNESHELFLLAKKRHAELA